MTSPGPALQGDTFAVPFVAGHVGLIIGVERFPSSAGDRPAGYHGGSGSQPGGFQTRRARRYQKQSGAPDYLGISAP